MRTIERLTVLVMLFCVAGLAKAEYVEDWEAPTWANGNGVVNNNGWGPAKPVSGANCFVRNLNAWIGETDSQIAEGNAAGGASRIIDLGDVGTGLFEVRAVIRVNYDPESRAGLYLGNDSVVGDTWAAPLGFLTAQLRGPGSSGQWNGMYCGQYDVSALTDDVVVVPGFSFAGNGWTELKILANKNTGEASAWYRNVVDNITPTPLEDWQLAFDYTTAQNYTFTHLVP